MNRQNGLLNVAGLLGGIGLQTWLLIGGGIVIILLMIGLKIQSARFAACQAEFAAFVAETKAIGEAAKRRAEMEKEARRLLTEQKEKDYAEKVQRLEGRLAAAITAARVRKPDSSSGGVPALSTAAGGITCPDRAADIAGRLERLEIGILERLVGPGNRALAQAGLCKEWLEGQVKVNAGRP